MFNSIAFKYLPLLLMATVLNISEAAALFQPPSAVKDLPVDESAVFDVRVYRTQAAGNVGGVFYDVIHDRTNSLTCDINVAIPLENGNLLKLFLRDVTVLPRGAFGSPVQYRLDPAEVVGRPLVPKFMRIEYKAANCRGHDPREHLDDTICQKVNPKHEETCRLVQFGNYYPLLSRGTYLGTCECR